MIYAVNWSTRRLTLTLLPMLLCACAGAPQPTSNVQQPLIPPLPSESRQQPRSQTHSSDAQQTIDSWLPPLTSPTPGAEPAKPTTTP